MFSQLSEQVKKSSQPFSDLIAANVKVLQEVSNQQTSLVSGVLSDSMKLMQAVGQQSESKDLLAAQGVYVESVRERLTITSKNTFSNLNAMGQQFADSMRTSFESTNAEVAKPKALVSTPSAKKAPVKKATTSGKVKPVTKKASTPKPVKAKKATTAKPVDASKAVEKKPAIVTKTATPAPKLSADNVLATPKVAVEKNSSISSEKNAVKA